MFGFKKKASLPPGSVTAVVSGKIVPLESVKDEAFAKKMMGDGAAILPEDDYVVAPCDGTLTMIYPTLHAFGVTSSDGVDILVHIGIDTVNLKGKGFRRIAEEGQKVHTGDKIIKMDFHELESRGVDMTTMILFPGHTAGLDIKREGHASRGKTVVAAYTL